MAQQSRGPDIFRCCLALALLARASSELLHKHASPSLRLASQQPTTGPSGEGSRQRCSLYRQLHEVPPGAQALKLSQKVHYGKCAVVSSSGAMLKHNFGYAIDAADAVLRFGAADVHRFTSHTGERETFRLLNRAVTSAPVRNLQVGAFDSGFFLLSNGVETQPGIVPLGELLPGLMHVLMEKFPQLKYQNGHEVSSGMTGIVFLLRICDEVALYEMVPSSKAHGMPWHYWEPFGDASHNFWHNSLVFEQALWRLLAVSEAEANTGLVRLNGFQRQAELCGGAWPTALPPMDRGASGSAGKTLEAYQSTRALSECGRVSFTLDTRGQILGAVTDEQRCALYCWLRHIPVGDGVQELLSRVHYDSCAVVSSTGEIPSWNYAEEIDLADAVMRFDTVSTYKLNRTIGSKETFRLLNAALQSGKVSGLRLGEFGNGFFLLTDAWPKDAMPTVQAGFAQSELLVAQPGILSTAQIQQGLTQVLAGAFAQFTDSPGHKVTRGMLGTALMLNVCNEVALYEKPKPTTNATLFVKGAPPNDPIFYEEAVYRILGGPKNTRQSGVLRLEGFQRQQQRCRAPHLAQR